MISHILKLIIIVSLFCPYTFAADDFYPATTVDDIRMDLVNIQLTVEKKPSDALGFLQTIETLYNTKLSKSVQNISKNQHQKILNGFRDLSSAIKTGSATEVARIRAQIWTSLLATGYIAVEKYISSGNAKEASKWLSVREYRKSTRFSRPNSDATMAIEKLIEGKISKEEATVLVRADLWDTYQARFLKTLQDLKEEGLASIKIIENKALAQGYFSIFESSYKQQRRVNSYTELSKLLDSLSLTNVKEVQKLVSGFRAAPLSQQEKMRRVGQLQRFITLVPVEYSRGVQGGKVHKDFEIMEAVTFRDGAEAALADIKPYLANKYDSQVEKIEALLASLKQDLSSASKGTQIAEAAAVQSKTDQILGHLKNILPAEWQKRSVAGDFDAIYTVLDQMETAVAQGEYNLAETARLEAYAILDTGPEAKLVAFAPQFIPELESLFWYGSDQNKGLARLLQDKSSISMIKETRLKLNEALEKAQEALGGGTNSPTAVTTNSAIIVFREGLEAVLIIAAMMAGFHRKEYQHLKTPLLWGVGAAFIATVLTWMLAREILVSLAQYGERLEAVISLMAVVLLLLITNWFFHKSYWTGWLQGFQAKKWSIAGSRAGQVAGMVMLGFDSVYREGFETVLFLQALVLDAGLQAVLIGILIGLVGVSAVGFALFKIQIKLPYKKMLVFTGALIVSVLVTMVGSTVHSFQVVGWLPTHPIRELTLPYWAGLWMGVFATWEGILLQIFSVVFVLGSYFLATNLNKRKDEAKRAEKSKATAIVSSAT